MATTEIILSTQALDGSLTPAKVSTNPVDNFAFPGNISITDDKKFILGNSGNAFLKYGTATGNIDLQSLDATQTYLGMYGIGAIYSNTLANGTGTYLPAILFGNDFAHPSTMELQADGVSINAVSNIFPDASALLDIQSTTKGFLAPRMTTVERDAIVSPATGLQIYNTTTNQPEVYNGTIWTSMAGGSTSFVDDVFTAVADGTGQIFTLSQTAISNSEVVNHNGLVLRPTVDYTISGTTLTILENVSTGESIQATYAHDIGGAGVTPGGPTTSVQFNNAGTFFFTAASLYCSSLAP